MAETRGIIQTNKIEGGDRTPILVLYSNGYFSSSWDFETPIPLPYSGASAIGTTFFPSMCQISGDPARVFVAYGGSSLLEVFPHPSGAGTGGSVRYLNLTDAEGNDDATHTAPNDARICCIYRGRLVASDRSNFYMSRAGQVGNWDYTLDDRAAAIAGNTLSNGALGDIHTALAPQTNDNLIIFCSRSIYQVIGDLANGGTIEMLSRDIGCFGPEAWSQDDEGNIYFAGPTGFYRLPPGGRPVNLSKNRVSTFFEQIESDINTTQIVQVRYDGFRKLVYVFVTKRATAESSHLVYDIRQDAWLAWDFPIQQGPMCSCVYLGSSHDENLLLIGGRDGVMRKLDPSATSDDGTAINSYAFIGPLEPAGPAQEAMCVAVDLTMGEAWASLGNSDFQADVQLQAGNDPYLALTSPEQTKAFDAITSFGVQDRQAARFAGEWIWLRIGNSTLDKTWAMDRAVGHFLKAGQQDGENVT